VVVAAALPLSWACAADDVLDALGPELLGSPVGRVLEESKFSCTQDRTEPDTQRCSSKSSALTAFGEVSASALEALIKDRRLLQVAVYFPEAQFTRVLAVLSTRFGEGHDWTVTIRSGMAGQLPDHIRIWESDRFALVAQQYDRKIDRSSVIYGSVDVMAPLLRRIRSTPRGALRDL